MLKPLSIVICLAIILSSCSQISPFGDCPPNAQIDWVDVLKINDIQYMHEFPDSDEELVVDIAKGNEIGEVTYMMADNACSNHRMKNGHAAFLKPGTAIYSIAGYPENLVVMAEEKVYVVNENKEAETIGELRPIDGLLKNIHVESDKDGHRIHTFTQASKEQFLNAWLSLKIEDLSSFDHDDERIFLEFELMNGITFREVYWPTTNTFHSGAVGNEVIEEIIRNELDGVTLYK